MDVAPSPSSGDADFSDRQLRASYWWVTHRASLMKVAMVALAAVDLALLSFSAFGFVDWYFLSAAREREQETALTRSFADYVGFRQRNLPAPLTVGDAVVLPSGDGIADVFAEIGNPNERWWAEYTFAPEGAGGAGQIRRGFILPGEIKTIRSLGVSRDSGTQLVVENIIWHKVDNKIVQPDYEFWSAERLAISTLDVAFIPAGDAGSTSRATFVLRNDSAYGYFSVTAAVILKSAGRPIGVGETSLSRLRPGEERQVDLAWFSDIRGVTEVQVVPEVNIFDPSNYLPPGA